MKPVQSVKKENKIKQLLFFFNKEKEIILIIIKSECELKILPTNSDNL